MENVDLDEVYRKARGERGALDDGERRIRQASLARLMQFRERVAGALAGALALNGFRETVEISAGVPRWDADGGICSVMVHAYGPRLEIGAEVDLSQMHGDGASPGIAGSSPVRLSVTDRETMIAETGSVEPAFEPASLAWSVDRDAVEKELLRVVDRLASDLSADGTGLP
jgi:hypothetical protein